MAISLKKLDKLELVKALNKAWFFGDCNCEWRSYSGSFTIYMDYDTSLLVLKDGRDFNLETHQRDDNGTSVFHLGDWDIPKLNNLLS